MQLFKKKLLDLSDLALRTTSLIILNEEVEDIMKIVKSLEESEFAIRGISKTIKNKAKEQKGGFLPMFLGILAASILRNPLRKMSNKSQ